VSDPFQVLGLPATATLAEVRAARRRLARAAHPDVGGDERRMREINQAFDQAVRRILGRPERPGAPPPPPKASDRPRPAAPPRPWETGTGPWVQHDEPSFTIDVLPVDAFAALERVAAGIGEVVAEDAPYLLEVLLQEPAPCWCRLELLPEAGATTVMMTVAGIHHRRPPLVEDVRDTWIDALNQRR